MIHEAKATCSNGHTVEFGACNKEVTKFLIFKSICTSIDHEVISRDEIQCQQCKTIHLARTCPKCNDIVPISRFRLKTLMERLRR